MQRIRGPCWSHPLTILVMCAVLATLPGLAGCGGKGMVSASATDAAMQAVLKRHDAAVNAPGNPLGLNDVEKSTALRSSALLRTAWDTALERAIVPVKIETAALPVPATPPRGESMSAVTEGRASMYTKLTRVRVVSSVPLESPDPHARE